MEELTEYRQHLLEEEKSPITAEKYLRDARAFLTWLGGEELSKARVLEYKALLLESYAVSSVNSMLSAINSYLVFIGQGGFRVKTVKRQRSAFLPEERELSRAEYERLLKAAVAKPRLRLIMQTICSTGIRVSEHRFITVEAARTGCAEVRSKGKLRRIILPRELCRCLLRYAGSAGIRQGSIFVSRYGAPLDRSRIWAEMKKLCRAAGVAPEKVFPHNLRHLFARVYYSREKDIVRLADILGHASVNTTRIYTMESGRVHRCQIEKLRLVCAT